MHRCLCAAIWPDLCAFHDPTPSWMTNGLEVHHNWNATTVAIDYRKGVRANCLKNLNMPWGGCLLPPNFKLIVFLFFSPLLLCV